jgi:hypothetical protein
MTLKSKSYIVNVGDDKEIFQKIKKILLSAA